MGSVPPSIPNFTYLFGNATGNPNDIGFAQATNPSTGDYIQVSENTQTANSGLQGAVSALIDHGNEQLTQFGNGAVSVSTGSGTAQGSGAVLAEQKQGNHEELYGYK